MILSNRKKIFSNLKDRSGYTGIRHGIFGLRCEDCDFKRFFRTYNLDIERSVKHVLFNCGSTVNKHIHCYPGHSIAQKPWKILSFKNEFDVKIAFERMKNRK